MRNSKSNIRYLMVLTIALFGVISVWPQKRELSDIQKGRLFKIVLSKTFSGDSDKDQSTVYLSKTNLPQNFVFNRTKSRSIDVVLINRNEIERRRENWFDYYEFKPIVGEKGGYKVALVQLSVNSTGWAGSRGTEYQCSLKR